MLLGRPFRTPTALRGMRWPVVRGHTGLLERLWLVSWVNCGAMASLRVAVIVRLPARRLGGGDELVPARRWCVVRLLDPRTGLS